VETAASELASVARARRGTPRSVERIQASVRGLVANPEQAAAYAPVAVAEQSGPFAPTSVPSLEGSPVDYLIITPASLATPLDPHGRRPRESDVETVEWIEANHSRGTDRAKRFASSSRTRTRSGRSGC
jgi:hypothetical protein